MIWYVEWWMVNDWCMHFHKTCKMKLTKSLGIKYNRTHVVYTTKIVCLLPKLRQNGTTTTTATTKQNKCKMEISLAMVKMIFWLKMVGLLGQPSDCQPSYPFHVIIRIVWKNANQKKFKEKEQMNWIKTFSISFEKYAIYE